MLGDAGWAVRPAETGTSADLGGSSKYFNENLKDRSGERFHVNSGWTWVSRSKAIGKFRFKGALVPRVAKGKPVNIPAPGCGFCAVTQLNAETTAGAPGRVLFSS